MLTSFQIPQAPLIGALYTGHHLLQADFLEALCHKYGQQVALITDSHVKQLYGRELSQKLGAKIFEVPKREQAKTRQVKQRIEDQMLKAGLGRDTIVLALGGGSVTDLAGFVASTYMRGVPLILLPTTLLGMVDAAIGGKTGLNVSFGKNLIGTFYHPKAVVCDMETLKTLPKKEILNGMAEIIKMGLTWDVEILQLIDKAHTLADIVKKASQAKIAVIANDPCELGLRRILNFGHTIAHALESLSNYKLLHGQAVAIGCLIESYLSFLLGYLSQQEFFEIERIYTKFFKKIRLPKAYHRESLLQSMRFDKKISASDVRFVLIDKIGHTLEFNGDYCCSISKDIIDLALIYMENYYA